MLAVIANANDGDLTLEKREMRGRHFCLIDNSFEGSNAPSVTP